MSEKFIELASERSIREELATELSQAIARLFALCGQGLHIDNHGCDYEALSAEQKLAFDEDVSDVFRLCSELDLEPHEEVLKVMSQG